MLLAKFKFCKKFAATLPIPPHWNSYTRTLLVSKDRRHLFVTPRFHLSSKIPGSTTFLAQQHRVQEAAQGACLANAADPEKLGELRGQLVGWRTQLSDGDVPAVVGLELTAVLEQLEQRLRGAEREVKKLAAEDQMKKAIGKD